MSEVNRTSASEQARADHIKASQKKANLKQAQSKATQQGSQQAKAQAGQEKMKSAFDKVLEPMLDETAMPLLPNEAKFDAKLQEIQQHEDRDQGDDSGDDDEHKTKDQGEKLSTKRDSSGSIQGRVRAKQGLKSQTQGQGSDTGDQQQNQSGRKSSTGQTQMLKQDQLKAQQTPAPTPGMASAGLHAVQAAAAPQETRPLPKALLDKIIQSVTVLKDKELKKEIQIDFHDNFFNGLKLKVSTQGSEIRIEFIVPNQDVQDTFKAERDQIAMALGKKGIEVRSIEVHRR